MSRGKFITLEGIDGAGKSTHIPRIAEYLGQRGKEVVVTREPGGTPLGEQLRALLLSEAMHVETETLLVFAARREHIHRVIAPALSTGRWVVCDRFTDATFAYQGGGRGLEPEKLARLEHWVQPGLAPDLTLVFDIPIDEARKRLAGTQTAPDRFEQEDPGFFERVREIYLARAAAQPARIKLIDGSQARERVEKQVEKVLEYIVSMDCIK